MEGATNDSDIHGLYFFNLRDNLNSEGSMPFPSDRVEDADLWSG